MEDPWRALLGLGVLGVAALLAIGNEPEKSKQHLEASTDGQAAVQIDAGVQERLSDSGANTESHERQQSSVSAPRLFGRDEVEEVRIGSNLRECSGERNRGGKSRRNQLLRQNALHAHREGDQHNHPRIPIKRWHLVLWSAKQDAGAAEEEGALDHARHDQPTSLLVPHAPSELKPSEGAQEEANDTENAQQRQQRLPLNTGDDKLGNVGRELHHVTRLETEPHGGTTVEKHVDHTRQEGLPGERDVGCAVLDLIIEIASGKTPRLPLALVLSLQSVAVRVAWGEQLDCAFLGGLPT